VSVHKVQCRRCTSFVNSHPAAAGLLAFQKCVRLEIELSTEGSPHELSQPLEYNDRL